MIQPAFSRQKIHELTDVMVRCAERLDKRWSAVVDAGGTINITEETSRFALDLILISTFGDDATAWTDVTGENPFAFLSDDSTPITSYRDEPRSQTQPAAIRILWRRVRAKKRPRRRTTARASA